ncbi:mechanosensitive ion channel family protein [Paracoccaceae bacterium GXU_MW_L88]
MEEFLSSQTWQNALTIWDQGYRGVDVQRILIAVGVIVVALILRKLVAAILVRILRGVFGRRNKAFGERLGEIFGPPLSLVAVVAGILIASNVVSENEQLQIIGQEIARSLIVFGIFWALYRAIVPSYQSLSERSSLFNPSMLGVASAGTKLLVAVLGAAMILDVWGIKVGPILAGFGLLGAAVALGAQDLFKNLIGGIFIIAERRFQIGDWIMSDGVCDGTVEKIGLRTTKIRQFDQSPIYVPNAELSDNPVVNYAEMPFRRISWVVGVTYTTTVPQLREIRDGIAEYIHNSDDFANPDEVSTHIRIDSFGDSAINIMVYCFTRTTVYADYLRIKEQLAYKISDIVEKAGSGFAFPSQSLYLETLPKGAELFPAHQEQIEGSAENSDSTPQPQG